MQEFRKRCMNSMRPRTSFEHDGRGIRHDGPSIRHDGTGIRFELSLS
jgi:hypothetical protein